VSLIHKITLQVTIQLINFPNRITYPTIKKTDSWWDRTNCQGLEAWQAQTLSIPSVSLYQTREHVLSILCRQHIHTHTCIHTHTKLWKTWVLCLISFLHCLQTNSEIAKKTFMFHLSGQYFAVYTV